MWGDSGRQGGAKGDMNFGKADTPSNSTHVGRPWETRGDKGRQGEARGDKWRQDPREGGHTIHYRHTCGETVGDKGRQGETRPSGRRTHYPTQAHMWGDSGRRQWEKTVGEDSGRQGGTRGDKWRQDPREGRHTILCRHTCGETVGDSGRLGETHGDKTLGKADTPSNTGTHVGRQWETRGGKGKQDPREGGHTIQHRHTCGETVRERKAHRLSDPWPMSKNWTVAWSTITSPWWTRKWLCRLSALPMIVKGRYKPTPPYIGQSSTYGQGLLP